MPVNSSATGGYLPQVNTPLSDPAMEDVITAAISGILSFDNSMIRPRWQALPARQPPPTTNWVAIGITDRTAIDYPYIKHFNGGPDQLTRWSRITVAVSVYGPNAQGLAEQLRDGFYVSQNLEALATSSIKLTDIGSITAVPDLYNVQWINRADMEMHLAVATNRTYNVLDIASSQGTITAVDGATTTAVWNAESTTVVSPWGTEFSTDFGPVSE